MHSVAQWLPVSVTLVLQVLVLGAMLRGRFRSGFPVFFSFVAFSAASIALRVLLAPHINATAYFYVYWGLAAVTTIFLFLVLYEVFVQLLKPYSALVDLGKLLFRWAAVFLALVSLVTAVATTGSQADRICAIIQLLERSCELMQCGFLLLFLLFQNRLGISWRSPAVCIVLGFGANAALLLSISFLADCFPRLSNMFDLVSSLACLVVYAAWCASFALPQPARRTALDSPSRLIFQRWNEAVMATPLISAQSQVAAFSSIDSFLPGVERTVERVMAQKMMH